MNEEQVRGFRSAQASAIWLVLETRAMECEALRASG